MTEGQSMPILRGSRRDTAGYHQDVRRTASAVTDAVAWPPRALRGNYSGPIETSDGHPDRKRAGPLGTRCARNRLWPRARTSDPGSAGDRQKVVADEARTCDRIAGTVWTERGAPVPVQR